MINNIKRSRNGVIALPLIFALSILILAVGVGMSSLSFNETANSLDFTNANKAMTYAETGARDALVKIARSKSFTASAYTIDITGGGNCGTTLDGCASTTVTSSSCPKTITSVGTSGTNKRTLVVTVACDANGVITTTTWVQS